MSTLSLLSRTTRMRTTDGSALARRSLLGLVAAAMVSLLPAAVQAQAADTGFDQPAWTGTVQDVAAARKEAAAALAEGRRECARRAEGRAACLKQVQDDHSATLQRLKTVPAQLPATAAGKRKP